MRASQIQLDRFKAIPGYFGRGHAVVLAQLATSVLLGLFSLWLIGYVLFLVHIERLKPEQPDKHTDIIVVLTGGSNRIGTGFDLMMANKADAMLITGVHEGVKMRDLLDLWPNTDYLARQKIERHCCISLEYMAGDTEGNAQETARWLLINPFLPADSVRVVTSNYHMPRAMLQFSRALPGVELISQPVEPSQLGITKMGFWRNTVIEYSKFIMTWLSTRLG